MAGLYTQLWGMVWLAPALAQGVYTLRTGRGYTLSTLLLAVVLLGHLVMGYIAVLSLVVLAGLGLLVCLGRWRQCRYRVPVTLALLWLLLYLGRPTWGPWLDLLPFSRDLHFHRLIAGLHLAGIYLAGLGLAWLPARHSPLTGGCGPLE